MQLFRNSQQMNHKQDILRYKAVKTIRRLQKLFIIKGFFFYFQVREFLRGVAARHPNFVSTLIEVYRPRVEALKNKGLWTMKTR